MSKQKLTPWFPVSAKPVHDGVYEVRLFSFTAYARWNGTSWGRWDTNPDDQRLTEAHTVTIYKAWRGLASDPNCTKEIA